MRRPEIGEAYRELDKQWTGRQRRLREPGHNGFPDFLLTHPDYPGLAAFVEVKAVERESDIIGATFLQCAELDALMEEGFSAFILTFHNKLWYIHQARPRRPLATRTMGIYLGSADRRHDRLTPAFVWEQPGWATIS